MVDVMFFDFFEYSVLLLFIYFIFSNLLFMGIPLLNLLFVTFLLLLILIHFRILKCFIVNDILCISGIDIVIF